MADLLPLLVLVASGLPCVGWLAALAYARSLSRRLARARVRLVRAVRVAEDAEGLARVRADDRVTLREMEAADLARRLARVEAWVGRVPR